jgi:hypothetical protein
MLKFMHFCDARGGKQPKFWAARIVVSFQSTRSYERPMTTDPRSGRSTYWCKTCARAITAPTITTV